MSTPPAAELFAETRSAPSPHVPLSIVYRGSVPEAVHVGSVAVVDSTGRLLYAAGDPWHVTTTRSALKPFQAIPFVAAGGLREFGLSAAQAALLCASHSGEERHIAGVSAMLRAAGNSAQDLLCGTHAPMFYEAQGEVPPPPPYSPLAHNCSGKHAGMLAYCRLCKAPVEQYIDPEHAVQRAIRAAVAHFCGMGEEDLVACIDGCSAPNYALPLERLAFGFARLASGSADDRYGDAGCVLGQAMTAHPEMVSGEGRNDLAYMRAGRGDWVTKVGAEGVQGIGVRSAGIGLAIKVGDGAKRGLHPATVEVLDQLGLLDAAQREELAGWHNPVVRNYRGIATGMVRPVVKLQRI
ncbi:MAG: asparaginase [Pseudomonadota bacterium]|nr:asparaginase [Pseudomonadota bacterium]